MNRFKMPSCGGNQYTACDTAEGVYILRTSKLERWYLESEEK